MRDRESIGRWYRAAIAERPAYLSGHQDREARVAQGGACDAAEDQLVQAGVAVGTHDEEICAEGGGLRQQQTSDVFAVGRQPSYVHFRAVTRQVARDVRSGLLAVIPPATLRVDD